jgi:glycosyltransferase involved in cell wall biosynthesis
MKKKVFLILSSLRAGGAERVFWLLAQDFDKTLYDVTLIVLNSNNAFFSLNLENVRVIDLKTIKASRSVFKLFNLIRKEKPYAVFSTGGQIDILLGFISLFQHIPVLIARPTNVDKANFADNKSRFLDKIGRGFYKRFDVVICQSDEIKKSVAAKNIVEADKLVVIPNPVIQSPLIRQVAEGNTNKKLIVVSRLTEQKGISRLIDMMKDLPDSYSLTIAGDGPLKGLLADQIKRMNLNHRVELAGTIPNVRELVSQKDLFVLPSYIEGFPNVVIESLSVGVPVVSFEVGGMSQIIINDFNGYMIEQNNLEDYKDKVIKACNKSWEPAAIKQDINNRFGIRKITQRYESLIS